MNDCMLSRFFLWFATSRISREKEVRDIEDPDILVENINLPSIPSTATRSRDT